MYLEDVCVGYCRALQLAVFLFAAITCDYGINDNLQGRLCHDTHYLPALAAWSAPTGRCAWVVLCVRVSMVSLVSFNPNMHTLLSEQFKHWCHVKLGSHLAWHQEVALAPAEGSLGSSSISSAFSSLQEPGVLGSEPVTLITGWHVQV